MSIQYPFSPERLDTLPQALAERFRALENKLLSEICTRLNVSGQLNEVTVNDIKALKARGIELEEIKKAISENTELGRNELDSLLDDVVKRNQNYYTEMIDITKVTAPDVLVDKKAIDAIRRQTAKEYTNITRSMGFVVQAGGKTKFLDSAKAYQWALDQAALEISSGAIDYNKAIREAVKKLADSGLKTVNYSSGYVDNVDVAVRRAVMTGINQTCQKYAEKSLDYLETDLVEVSAHSGARDTGIGIENHAQWQGKVYRWKKKKGNSTGNYPDFEESTGYGEGAGLGGWNCRHHFYPYVEGVSQRTYTDKELNTLNNQPEVTYQGKTYNTYAATQKQREIERTIRKVTREELAFEKQGNMEEAELSKIRLSRLKAEYNNFSKAANLTRQPERTRVYDKNN